MPVSHEMNISALLILILLIAVLVIVLSVLIGTARQHRRHAAMTDRKRCPTCRQEHPAFATFCRRCGSRFGEPAISRS